MITTDSGNSTINVIVYQPISINVVSSIYGRIFFFRRLLSTSEFVAFSQ